MLNLIVSPKAQNNKAESIAKAVVKYLKTVKVEYSVYFSQTFEELRKNVETLMSFGENEYIVVGDDVVLSEVLNSVKDVSKIKLGIIPTSKQDDFASYLGLESHPIEAIKKILEKQVDTIDLLLVNNMRVLNTVIVGASANMYEAYDQFKVKNIISKQYASIKFANAFDGIELSLDVKGSKTKKENIFELIVANGGKSKGKAVSPLANVEDGLFNVSYSTMEDSINKKKTVRIFQEGEHIYDERTKQQWVTNLKITNPEKQIKALIDGRVYNLESLEITLIEKGLKIYRSKI